MWNCHVKCVLPWTLCESMDYSPPVSSVHGISQARILEWVAISYSRASSWPRKAWLNPCLLHEQSGSLHWAYGDAPIFSSCCSVSQLCLILCNPMDCSIPVFPVLHHIPEFAQTHVLWVNEAIQPSHPLLPLLLLPSIFPSIRIFSNESALCIRWPKYWSFSFSFSISSSNEYSGLISFRID